VSKPCGEGREEVDREAKHLQEESLGTSPQKSSYVTWGCPKEGLSSGKWLALWVAKSLGSDPDHLETRVEMVEAQGYPKELRQAQGDNATDGKP
jgi:hypothetical protein